MAFIDARLAGRLGYKLTLQDDNGNGLNITGDPNWRSIDRRMGTKVRFVAQDVAEFLDELGQGWTITVDDDGTSVRERDRIMLAVPFGIDEWAQGYDSIHMAISTGSVRERTVA